MRVRAAGALLLAPLLAVTYAVMEGVGRGGNGNTIAKALFWDGAGSYQPKAWLVVRDGIFFAVLVIAIVAICGPRFSRWLVALAGVGLIVLYVPWVIYDYYNFSASRPPNWLVKNYPWYLPVRTSAIMWIVVLALAVVLALTDRDPRQQGRPSRYVQPPQPQAQPTQQFAPRGYPPPPGPVLHPRPVSGSSPSSRRPRVTPRPPSPKSPNHNPSTARPRLFRPPIGLGLSIRPPRPIPLPLRRQRRRPPTTPPKSNPRSTRTNAEAAISCG